MSDTCQEWGCIPPAAELARLAENASVGRSEAFVGTGHPDTAIACEHGSWRLGDLLDAAGTEPDGPKACGGVTRAGDPCQGRAGEDGFCAAHKETPAP